MPSAIPKEQAEQTEIATWLDRRAVIWEHTPNGGGRTEMSGRVMRQSGQKRGSSDIKIFNKIPGQAWIRGVSIELKRVRGGRESKEQEARREEMESCGWLCFVAHGADEVKVIVIGLGLCNDIPDSDRTPAKRA